ncbi:hypothetical protein KUL106_25530 [Alteromonas sp. KUL106]|nr:hypothetical protein KUL106_25530 [Alteromonas sp. KUL106]
MVSSKALKKPLLSCLHTKTTLLGSAGKHQRERLAWRAMGTLSYTHLSQECQKEDETNWYDIVGINRIGH